MTLWTPDKTLWKPGDPLDFRPRRDRRRLPIFREYGYGYPCCCEGGPPCDYCTGGMPDGYNVTFSGVANGTCGTAAYCTGYWNDTFPCIPSTDEPVNNCLMYFPGPGAGDYDTPGHDCGGGCGAQSYLVQVLWYTLLGNYGVFVQAALYSEHCATTTVDFYKEWASKPDCSLSDETLTYDPLTDTMTACDFSSATCTITAT